MNSAKPKIIHVVYRETLNQVLESQVLRPVARLASEEPDLEIEAVALTPVGLLFRDPWRERVESLRARAKSEYGIVFRTPAGLPARLQNDTVDDRLLVRALRKSLDRDRRNILHCRGAHAARCALVVASGRDNVEVIFDCRGDDPAEVVARLGVDPDQPGSWAVNAREAWRRALQLEARVVAGVDAVVCVSGVLKELLVDRHGADADKISVLPCAVDCDSFSPRHRESARRELGLEEKFVLGYVGSVNWYQCIEESLDLFSAIRSRHANAHFFGITTDRDLLHRALVERGIDEADFTLRSVPSSEVAKWVPAMDAGLLIRRPNPVNAVASPVKFGEYLASGVPVITTPEVGDFSSAVGQHRLGTVVSFSNSKDQVDSSGISLGEFDSDARQRCRDFAKRYLSTVQQAENFRRLYGLESVSSTGSKKAIKAETMTAALPMAGV